MRLLLIRHGDPDYAHDTLTEKGRREAALLAEEMKGFSKAEFYVSPLGRARDTAAFTCRQTGKEPRILDWLEEFPAKVDINDSEWLQRAYPDTRKEGNRFAGRIAWDMLPAYWTSSPEYFDRMLWRNTEVAAHSDLIEKYDRAAAGLDALLAVHGYARRGNLYQVREPNEETLVFFCHFGISCVLLSHLWGVSPFVLWHSMALAPTSVTELVTEEREKGYAYFRAVRIGDISHLYTAGEEPSFAARFCETYENTRQRH